jgi:methylmalonyl-CoA/ethylmalonyl-CoA epimerase
VRTTSAEPRHGTFGSKVAFLHPKDTGGVLVELVEANPDGQH